MIATTATADKTSPVLATVRKGEPLTPWQHAMAGDSIFTLVSRATGARYTYRIRYYVGKNEQKHFYVSLLRGPDNTRDYTDLGEIYRDGTVHSTWYARQAGITASTPAVIALQWFLRAAQRGDAAKLAQVEIVPSGRCIVCNRLLTVPSSVCEQIGPKCAQRLG